MVGVCTAIIGIIPSYQTIGITAAILFLFFRILQNISVGGEYISSIAYLIENADQKEKGFYGSWVSVGFNMGTLFASLMVFILTYYRKEHFSRLELENNFYFGYLWNRHRILDQALSA
jgi:MHS family proline/betaine transporter-like MFS transporter